MADYPIVTESTRFRVTGVCYSCDPPVSFTLVRSLDKSLGELPEISGEKVAVVGSYWYGHVPGTCCSARVTAKSSSFDHEEQSKGFICTKDGASQIEVVVYNGTGQFVAWENTQDLAFFRD